MIKLNLKTLLPKVRAAYNEGRLQAQTIPEPHPGVDCRYSAPCAIGVGLKSAQARQLDIGKQTSINHWIDTGAVVVPNDQQEDIKHLQLNHDAWVTGVGTEAQFIERLSYLESKYLTA